MVMPESRADVAVLQRSVWSGSLPLEFRLASGDCRSFDESEPYLIQTSRLSYLGFLIDRLHTFFTTDLVDQEATAQDAWVEFEGVPLKWHYPIGLLYDLYSGAEPVTSHRQENSGSEGERIRSEEKLPWRLTIHYSEFPADQLIQLDKDNAVLLDAYINSVKEADYIRNGTARAVMSLSKEDADTLWRSVASLNMDLFNTIQSKLLNPAGIAVKHIPVKIYLPTAASSTTTDVIEEEAAEEQIPRAGHFRVVQTLIPLQTAPGQAQTVGTALNSVIPAIFPSRRNPLLAQPVLHGAVLPMSAQLDTLTRAASYLDGFLHIAIVMLG